MPYKRVDKDECVKTLKGFIERFANASSCLEQLNISDEYDKYCIEIETMQELAYIRFSQNTKDDFYVKEQDYWDEMLPEIGFFATEFNKGYVTSKFSKELRQHFPKVFFKNIELEMMSNDEKLIPLQVEENKLISSYTKLMSGITVEFNGEVLPPSGMLKYNTNPSRDLRCGAYTALGNAYLAHKDELDDIYNKLVEVRTREGLVMGFDNYSTLGYCNMKRNCYNKEDIAKFRENVKKYIVPLATKIKSRIAKEIGVDQMKLYDDGIYTIDEPKPIGTPEQLFDKAQKMYDEMSPITGELFKKMREIEAFDALSREGKWGGGYCINIDKYKTPFILSNFNGSLEDIGTLTHEFGHALAADRSFDIPFVQCREPSMETAEVHSMSMEFFSLPWMESFFGDNTKDFIFAQLSSAVCFLPYGTIVDYFQQTVYDNPSLSPKERNEFWSKIEKEFLPYITTQGIPFYQEGRRWQRQAHIYESPFYYIDYCFAEFTALQFLALANENREKAFDKYMKFLVQGGTKPFTELLESADLLSPFEEGSFIEISKVVTKLLDL